MDLKEVLMEALSRNGPLERIQYVNTKNKVYAVYMEIFNQILTIKDIKKISLKKQKKMWPNQKSNGTYKLNKKFKMSPTTTLPIETNELTWIDETNDGISESSYSCLNHAYCQTEPVIAFDKWTSLEDSPARSIGEQTLPISVNSLGLQTSDEFHETRYVQVNFDVMTRGNQTDFDTQNKNDQTDVSFDVDQYCQNNEAVLGILTRLQTTVNERNFNKNLESINNALKLPNLLKDMERVGAKAFLQQKRWGLKKFRLWNKHHRYLTAYKKAKYGSILENQKEYLDSCIQTDQSELTDVGTQSVMKMRKWYTLMK